MMCCECEFDPRDVFHNTSFSFIFYEWAQQAKVLLYTWLERLVRVEHSNLKGQFVSYGENKV